MIIHRMAVVLASLVITGPALAQKVPEINANVSATATATGATINTGSGGGTPAVPPAGWPPEHQMSQPTAPLDPKERKAVNMATIWRNKADTPVRDAGGVLRWRYGTSQARVVCAPSQICDIEMQPGEIINNVRIGDANWSYKKAISGGSEGAVSHVVVLVSEAGVSSSMIIYTDRRNYAIKLVAAQKDYTPLTGFNYPDDNTNNDKEYAAAVAQLQATNKKVVGGGADVARLEMLDITGDNPSWRPTAAYTDGRKTYLVFPKNLQYGESPTLVGVNNDSGLFSAASERRIIYRYIDDRVVIDSVQDKVKLILGVGSSQQKVLVSRRLP